ncbi:MAG: amidohydrolase [Gemmatimonadota bacterium]
MQRRFAHALLTAALICLAPATLHAQRGVQQAPDRPAGEGDGPYQRMVVHGVIVVDGTGAPPQGPMDIWIEGNRITRISSAGTPGLPRRERDWPEDVDTVIDAWGMYALPGFVDSHGHTGGSSQGTPAEYVYKLWLGHGVTTIRDPGSGNGVDWTLEARARSQRNEITAPRTFVYVRPGSGWDGGAISSPEQARAYVRWAAEKGVDGFKLGSYDPPIMEALLDEARQHGLGTQAHLAQTGVAQMDALDAARLGLGTLEHWYGLPESLFADRMVQHYPADYNYNNEYHRFAQAGRLWKQAAPQGSEQWNAVMDEMLELGFVLSPTMTIYEANRDVMRAREAEWHERYTLPSLWQFYQPSRTSHGSYWFDWTTQDEIEWKENFRIWMSFLNEYKNRGGRVCTGSDSGFIYKLYGFDFIREMELLQEAGFHPLEVITAATDCGAQTLMEPKGEAPEFGRIRTGMLADLVIVPENPVHNLKVLYGTGTLKLDENGDPVRVGGVRWTIKDGIVFDAPQLLRDVERMVAEAKRAAATTSSSAPERSSSGGGH